VGLAVEKGRVEAALEEVAAPFVPLVEALRIRPVEPLQPAERFGSDVSMTRW
jgi:hypothetical protein